MCDNKHRESWAEQIPRVIILAGMFLVLFRFAQWLKMKLDEKKKE